MTIKDLITSVKSRPGMFVETEKIEYIFYFLLGYCGSRESKFDDDINKMFICWFGKWLALWIRDNVDEDYAPSTAFWYNDLKNIYDENEVINCFYELCNEFFEDYENKKGFFEWRNR